MICRPPLYLMKPIFLNLFMKRFTRERVVPMVSASISCDILGRTLLGLVVLSIPGEQQKSASQPFLGRVEQLIDEVCLNADVPGQHIRDKAVGEFVFGVQNANHLVLLDNQHARRHNRGRRAMRMG